MRVARAVRTCLGHALISVLVATLILGTGAAATARWTMWLLLHERAAFNRHTAAQALHNAIEMGHHEDPARGSAGPGVAGTRPSSTQTLQLPDGSTLTVTESRSGATDGSDPPRGERIAWTARWVDPWGHARSLTLPGYWAPVARIY